MNTPLLLYQITLWLNAIMLTIFLGIEIFWFVKQKLRLRNTPSLVLGFFMYNLPFLLLAASMHFQPVPEGWIGALRLVFLALSIPVNLWLHYHGDKGGNSVGMAIVFFLLVTVPLILIVEIFIAFYKT